MMARIEGPVVSAIQGIVAENWLECCGEILTGQDIYKDRPRSATSARVRRQELAGRSRHRVARAVPDAHRGRRTIAFRISTPYFLPDKAFRRAFERATARGVRSPRSCRARAPISVGFASPAAAVRQLLKAGMRILEYQPGMTHVKTLIVDDLWSVDRHHEPRQPIVRAQRRGERGDPRSRQSPRG